MYVEFILRSGQRSDSVELALLTSALYDWMDSYPGNDCELASDEYSYVQLHFDCDSSITVFMLTWEYTSDYYQGPGLANC